MTLPGCHTHSILVGYLRWPRTSTWRWTASLTSTGVGAGRMTTLLPGKEDKWGRHPACWDQNYMHNISLPLLVLFHSFSHVYSFSTACFLLLWLIFDVLTSSFIFMSPPIAVALLSVCLAVGTMGMFTCTSLQTWTRLCASHFFTVVPSFHSVAFPTFANL